MDFTFSMGYMGATLLILGAVVFGVALYLIGNAHTGYEWLATAIAAGIGAFVASEFIVDFRTWEPVTDGLALVPAIAGGVALGGIVAVVVRYTTGNAFHTHSTA